MLQAQVTPNTQDVTVYTILSEEDETDRICDNSQFSTALYYNSVQIATCSGGRFDRDDDYNPIFRIDCSSIRK